MNEIKKGNILESYFRPDNIRVIDVRACGENHVKIKSSFWLMVRMILFF